MRTASCTKGRSTLCWGMMGNPSRIGSIGCAARPPWWEMSVVAVFQQFHSVDLLRVVVLLVLCQLHGLNIPFKCEICGDETYWGRCVPRASCPFIPFGSFGKSPFEPCLLHPFLPGAIMRSTFRKGITHGACGSWESPIPATSLVSQRLMTPRNVRADCPLPKCSPNARHDLHSCLLL